MTISKYEKNGKSYQYRINRQVVSKGKYLEELQRRKQMGYYLFDIKCYTDKSIRIDSYFRDY